MLRVRRRHVDDVDVRILNQGTVIAIGRGGAEPISELLRSLG